MILNYKAILFDWDGTLVDSADWVLSAHNHVRAIMGLEPWTKEDIFGCSSLSSREMYPTVYQEKSEEALALLYSYTNETHLNAAKPYSMAQDLLEIIKSQNIMMGIVSNKRHEPLLEMLDHLQWQTYFSGIVGAGKAQKDKPSAGPILLALSEMDKNLTPNDILYIGDTETDLLTAQNTGCDAVFIQSNEKRPDLIEKYAPLHTFDSLQELKSLIESEDLALNRAC